MYILTVCLSPEEMDGDPGLLSFLIKDVSQESIRKALNCYDIDDNSFHFYEYSYGLPNGSFETVENLDDDLDDGFEDEDEENVLRLSWVFEVFEAKTFDRFNGFR